LGDDWGFYFVCLARIEKLMFYSIKVGKLILSLRMVQIRYLIFLVCDGSTCKKTQNLEEFKENQNSSLISITKSLSCVHICYDENKGMKILKLNTFNIILKKKL
jgi:hypothetical protein